MTRSNKYETRTDNAVKEALLTLLASKSLADVTVSELARAANVSRSTFYEHFGNPADVYDALVADFAKDVSPLMSQVACSDGMRPAGRPFCELVRDAGPLAPAVDEGRFMDSFMGGRGNLEEHDLHTLLVDAGYTETQAAAVCSFQLSGCFSAARASGTAGVTDEEWASVRAVIDRFILGGIAACLASKR